MKYREISRALLVLSLGASVGLPACSDDEDATGGEGGAGAGDGDGDGDGEGGAPGDGDGATAAVSEVAILVNDYADDLFGVDAIGDFVFVSGQAGDDVVVGKHSLLDNAALVTSFGKDGVLTISGTALESTAVAGLSDGGVAVLVNNGSDLEVHRFDETGSVVEGFGTSGVATVNFGLAEASGFDILLAPGATPAEDKLVVFGQGPNENGDDDRCVARIGGGTGEYDTTFSTDGYDCQDFAGAAGDDTQKGGVVLADGGVVSSGYTNFGGDNGRHHIHLIHYDASGVLVGDTSYSDTAPLTQCPPATDGLICNNPYITTAESYSLTDGYAEAYAVVVTDDGAFITAGYGEEVEAEGDEKDFIALKYNPDGPDTDFGVAGALAFSSAPSSPGAVTEDRGRDLVLLPDGSTFHVGLYAGDAATFLVTPEGELDSLFGDAGIAIYSDYVGQNFRGVTLADDGTIIAVGDGALVALYAYTGD